MVASILSLLNIIFSINYQAEQKFLKSNKIWPIVLNCHFNHFAASEIWHNCDSTSITIVATIRGLKKSRNFGKFWWRKIWSDILTFTFLCHLNVVYVYAKHFACVLLKTAAVDLILDRLRATIYEAFWFSSRSLTLLKYLYTLQSIVFSWCSHCEIA